MFSMWEQTVRIQATCLREPFHTTTVSFDFPALLISRLTCAKDLVRVPRGPLTVTIRALALTVTVKETRKMRDAGCKYKYKSHLKSNDIKLNSTFSFHLNKKVEVIWTYRRQGWQHPESDKWISFWLYCSKSIEIWKNNNKKFGKYNISNKSCC